MVQFLHIWFGASYANLSPRKFEGKTVLHSTKYGILKITGITVFRPQKTLKKKKNINYIIHWPFQLPYTVVN